MAPRESSNAPQLPAIHRVFPFDGQANAASAAIPAFRITAVGAWIWFKIGIVRMQPAADPARSAAYSAPVCRGKRVRATHTTIPPKTKGIAARMKAKAVQAISFSGSTGIYNCAAKQIALVKAKSKPKLASIACASRFFISSTKIAPAARPNIASEIAMKAKWYHIVTLKMRDFTDRKSTRLNSSHGYISYAVFCLKKKKNKSNTYNAEM